MSTRISSAALLLLAACQQTDTAGNAPLPEVVETKMPCALAGATVFANDCTVERDATADGTILTLHHPDGGFRRVTVTTDGRGVAATDGAESVSVKLVDNAQIEVALARDRYRLPATVKAKRPA